MLILNTYKEPTYNLQVFSDPINHLCSAVATICQKRERKKQKTTRHKQGNVLTAQKAAVIFEKKSNSCLKKYTSICFLFSL